MSGGGFSLTSIQNLTLRTDTRQPPQPEIKTMQDTTDQSNLESSTLKITTKPAAILQLTSHANSPPLQPPPHLKYDLRWIQNPPKALRDSQTGLSKRLREHLLAHQDFQNLLDRTEGEIRSAMEAHLGEGQATASGIKDDPAAEGDKDEIEDKVILSVAAFCARGHHRSVAFIEELAMRKWPSGWEVRAHHRDLDRERSAHGKKHREGKENNKGRHAGGFDLVLGDD